MINSILLKPLFFLLTLVFFLSVISCKKKFKPYDVEVEVRNNFDGSPAPGVVVELLLYRYGFIGGGSSEVKESAITDSESKVTFRNLSDDDSDTKFQLRANQSSALSGSDVLDIDGSKKILINVFPLIRKRLIVQASTDLKNYSIAVSCETIFSQSMIQNIEGNSQQFFLFVNGRQNTVQIFRIFKNKPQRDTLFQITPMSNDTSAIQIKI